MKTAIVYYSMSGNTAYVADRLREQLDSEVDLIEIKPVKAFPDSGFKKFLWGGKSAVMAQKPKLQPYTFDAEKYDQIIIGFPVWWYREPSIIDTFMESYDFAGKTIVPFCTSGGSGLGPAGTNMLALAPGAKLGDGKRFSSGVSEGELGAWAEKF